MVCDNQQKNQEKVEDSECNFDSIWLYLNKIKYLCKRIEATLSKTY